MYKMKTLLMLLGAVLCFLALEKTTLAQTASSRFRSNLLNRPTVSPYLNLLNGTGSSGISNYHTLVRPQLEQRRLNQFSQQQFGSVNRQLQTINTQQQTGNAGTGGIRATGHRTFFQNHSHFYTFQQQR